MSGLVEAYLSGATVRHPYFVEFRFLSSTERVWNGFRYIEVGGYTWTPVGPTATVAAIEDPISGSAPGLNLSLSGVDTELLAMALASTDEVRGRLVFVYDAFFDEDWQILEPLSVYAMAKMDTVKVSRQGAEDGSWNRVISIPAEHLLTTGANPPAGRYSSGDQQARFPGEDDRYFEFMGQNQNKRLRWPTF